MLLEDNNDRRYFLWTKQRFYVTVIVLNITEVAILAAALIAFQDIPRFGFAHHVYTENTHQIQNDLQHSFVLVYVKSGHLSAQIYERTVEAPAGSV